MSWKEQIENVRFTIKTGDSKNYYPLLMEMEKTKDFNTSLFDFIDVPGTLIERKNPKGGKFPLTFYFQGENCFEIASDFETSSDDNRYWTVTHPIYGTIKGQPISISRNDRNLNVVEFKVDFQETIVFDFPYTELNVRDGVLVKKKEVLFSGVNSFANKQADFNAEDIQKLKQSNADVAASFEKVQTNETYSEYLNLLSDAQKSSDKLRVDASDAILKTQGLINAPSTYDVAVLPRVNSYKTMFENLNTIFSSIFDKASYETQGSTCIASVCEAAVNYQEETDFQVTTDVDYVVSTIVDMYNNYVNNIDNATVSGEVTNVNWQPSPDLQVQLNQLVIYTLAQIYQLAFDAMKERIVYLNKDSNIILLTHKYYGIASDENIENFCLINGIKLSERFKLKKGRKIKYYR